MSLGNEHFMAISITLLNNNLALVYALGEGAKAVLAKYNEIKKFSRGGDKLQQCRYFGSRDQVITLAHEYAPYMVKAGMVVPKS